MRSINAVSLKERNGKMKSKIVIIAVAAVMEAVASGEPPSDDVRQCVKPGSRCD